MRPFTEKQYFIAMLFVFQFYPCFNIGKCINFGLGTIRSESVKGEGGYFELLLYCYQTKS